MNEEKLPEDLAIDELARFYLLVAEQIVAQENATLKNVQSSTKIRYD